MVEILWHRRETRRQTEKTNLNLNIGRNQSTRLNSMVIIIHIYHDISDISDHKTLLNLQSK